MKFLKNKILSALMLTFVFFVMHDYFVIDNQISEYKNLHVQHSTSMEEAKVHMHEAAHIIWSMNGYCSVYMQNKLPESKPSNLSFSISSNITLVPQRPPSA